MRLVRRLLELYIDSAASIDFKTEAKIQAAVREEFKNACLLTIAHRIRTVIDYDRLVNTLNRRCLLRILIPIAAYLRQRKGC